MVMARLDRKNGAVQRRLIVPAILIAAMACGCKSSSWMARPTWLGGSPPPSSLSSAPAFEKGIAKPSDTQKPYPTTNTPQAYALDPKTPPDATRPSVAAVPAAVTYGSTPPASAAPSAIAPQVGPYASLQQPVPSVAQADPATAVTSGFGASPAFSGGMAPPPAQAAPPAGSRFADASGSSAGWTPPPAAQPTSPAVQPAAAAFPPATMPAPNDSRYGTATSSRFSGGTDVAQPTSFAPPPASQFSAPPPAAAAPAIEPASTPPASALPGTMTPPTRRPDPGYRPGGTSSYRPAKTLLADDQDDAGVQPASFSAP